MVCMSVSTGNGGAPTKVNTGNLRTPYLEARKAFCHAYTAGNVTEWQDTQRRFRDALDAENVHCEACWRPDGNLQLHHRNGTAYNQSFTQAGHEDLWLFNLLCEGCHKQVKVVKDAEKTTLEEATWLVINGGRAKRRLPPRGGRQSPPGEQQSSTDAAAMTPQQPAVPPSRPEWWQVALPDAHAYCWLASGIAVLWLLTLLAVYFWVH